MCAIGKGISFHHTAFGTVLTGRGLVSYPPGDRVVGLFVKSFRLVHYRNTSYMVYFWQSCIVLSQNVLLSFDN